MKFTDEEIRQGTFGGTMTTPPTHTPTPWKLEETELCLMIRDEMDDKEVALISPSLKDSPEEMETHRANAAFIVECVNQHAALKAAKAELLQSLKDVLSCYKRVWADAGKDQKGSLYIGIAEKAIARASGEQEMEKLISAAKGKP